MSMSTFYIAKYLVMCRPAAQVARHNKTQGTHASKADS